MKKAIICILFLLVSSCASTPPSTIYKHPEFNKNKSKVYKVSVLPFKDAKDSPDSGKIMADIFETALASSNRFEVVERMQLEKILSEQNLNLSGLIENPLSIGKMVKVDLVVIGSVTLWHQGGWSTVRTMVGASVKAVNVETGVTLWSIESSAEPIFGEDDSPYVPPNVIARKLCRKMIKDFIDSN